MLKEYRSLYPYFKKYLTRYIAGFIFLIITDGAQLVIPQIIQRAIDNIASGSFELRSIARYAVALALTAVVISSGRFLWRFFIHGSSRRIEKELRDKYFTHTLGLSASFFQKNKTGDLMARATNDMNAVRESIGMGLVAFVDGAFMSLAILVILFTRNARLALLTVAPLPLLTVLIISTGSLIGKRFERVQAGFSTMSEVAQETVSGIRVVASFVKENLFAGKFREANDAYRRANMSLVKLFGIFFPLVGFLAGITTLILLRFGGMRVIEGGLTPGEFVATFAYLEMLIWPMLGAGFTVNMLQRGSASLKRINEILKTEPEIATAPGAVSDVPSGDIAVRNLTVTYPDAASPALSGISVTIPKGTTLGILGRLGSGKSTFIKALPRAIEVPEGSVFIGGRDAREYDLQSLRRAFGFVPQDSFLFSATIRENIAFGKPDASDEEIRKYADISTISRDLGEFPAGLETPVGERGVTLSGGQKQRIAISRALCVDPEILVFDDALSSVDTETEKQILEHLLNERRGKTNIIISHRTSTLEIADQIIVLEKGKITQRGTHEELIEAEGLYADIHDLQRLEKEKAV